MLINGFDPLEDKVFRIIDNEGNVLLPEYLPALDKGFVTEVYRDMLFERVADEMAVSFQRQGRMYTYPPNKGQEAIHIAAGKIMQQDDWLVPAFRELGIMLAKGVTLKEVFLYYMGNEDGSHFSKANHVLPVSIPIASQFLHAVGIGFSINYNHKSEVVFPYVGDGGTSEGDFSEALNFAGVWNAPVVFTVQNNQYAISVPVKKQTKAINLAVKSYAFGIPGIKVDGNDFFAMYVAYKTARENAIAGKGPTLIEALTYRQGAHTTSDDPTKYRTKEEEAAWADTDPLKRLKLYMQKNGIETGDEEKLKDSFRAEVESQFTEAENYPAYPVDNVFRYTYVDLPEDLMKQKAHFEEFRAWKEGRK